MLKKEIIRISMLPLIRAEIPGWGYLYKTFIGSWRDNGFWENEPPRIIRDKRCGYYRIVTISEWADRALYFLGRWYDLEAALLVDALVKNGDRVLDVGANFGHFSLAAAKAVGPSGSVVSFEPNPNAYARLSLHLALNKLSWVEANNIGFSDTKDCLTLSIPSINSGEATFGASKYQDVSVVEVPVQRLDDIASQKHVSFLKIDVEGFEVHVLRGAKTILERDRPMILTEVVEKHLKGAGESRQSLYQLMKDMGYKSFLLGMKGRGARQELSLSAVPASECDGDFLWITPDKENQISYTENSALILSRRAFAHGVDRFRGPAKLLKLSTGSAPKAGVRGWQRSPAVRLRGANMPHHFIEALDWSRAFLIPQPLRAVL